MNISRRPIEQIARPNVRKSGRRNWVGLIGIYFAATCFSHGYDDVVVQSAGVNGSLTVAGGMHVDGIGAGNITFEEYTWDDLWITNDLSVSGGCSVNAIQTDYGWIDLGSLPDFLLSNGDGSLSSLTVTNGLSVDAETEITGNLDIGGAAASIDGHTWQFVDGNNTVSSNLTFNGGAGATFRWQQNGGDSPSDQMIFANDGQLTISDLSTGNYLTFKPEGNVLIHQSEANLDIRLINPDYHSYGNAFIDGSGHKIQLGAVSFANTTGALTFADNSGLHQINFDAGEKAVIFSNSLVLNGNSSLPAFTITASGFAIAGDVGGAEATAFGGNAHASGSQSVAISGGNVSAAGAGTAIGNLSIASANGSLAFGGGNASGNGAFALGSGATASGNLSTSIGTGVVTSLWGATTVGHFNVELTGSSTSWNSTAAAFVVGTGNSTTHANALVVANNGNLTISAPTMVGDAEDVATPSRSMQVNGAAVFNGAVTVSGAVTFTVAHGDVSMGDYGN